MSGRRILVVETDPSVRSALAAAVDGAEQITDLEALDAELEGPCIALIGPSFADDSGLARIGPLLRSRPAMGGILVASTLTTELLQSALRAGFRDVLAEPVDDAQLADSIGRVEITLPSVGLPANVEPEIDDGGRGRLITVFSTKGGAGSSVLATNVAVSLARQSKKKVILVDADLQFGDVSVMMKLAPRHTVVDAVASAGGLDAALLSELLVEHPASGVRVLSAPLEPAFADQVSADDLLKVVDLLRTMADYVVVDTPAYFNDVVLGVIEESDDVLLLAGMDIPNIKNVRIGLQTLRLLNTPMSKIQLVLNRSNSKVKLDVSEVERTLQVEVVCRIPSDVSVPQSVNKGVPIVLDAPKSGPAKAIDNLVKGLVRESVR